MPYINVNLRMQKFAFFFAALILITVAGCKEKSQQKTVQSERKEPLPVFPVTDYLLGQIAAIEKLAVTPLVIKTSGNQVDSMWIKREQVRDFAKPFLSPVIDSASLNAYFDGRSFLDQTVNAYTFTYDAKGNLPKEISLHEMNVYVEPEKNEVTRIYLVKNEGDSTIQLTWKAGKWFSIRTIIQKNDSTEVKEEKVKWNFDEQEK